MFKHHIVPISNWISETTWVVSVINSVVSRCVISRLKNITKMFRYKYLSKEHLNGFNKYKYSAIDTSPLSKYVMHPLWNALVKIVPKWIAPNLITFAGFLCMVLAILLLYVYDYDLYAAVGHPGQKKFKGYGIPNWLFTLCGVLIFLAYNLDGIDGKQARRLGVSGPLGELFDHGIDSYIVFLIPFSILSIFGRDPEYSVSCFRAFLVILSVTLNFYISHCEKYNTGTLYLPWGYDVSMWLCSLMFIIAGMYGPGVFKTYVFGDVTFAAVFEVTAHLVGLLTTLPVVVNNVNLSYKNRTGKMYPLSEAIRPVWSLSAVTITMIVWALKSPNDVIEYDPRAFIFLFGTLFSNISSRLIIAEMSHQRCELVCWMFWLLLAGVFVSLYQPQLELVVLYTMMLLALLAHLHYAVCVVRQICSHLKNYCFTVPKEKRK